MGGQLFGADITLNPLKPSSKSDPTNPPAWLQRAVTPPKKVDSYTDLMRTYGSMMQDLEGIEGKGSGGGF